MGKGHRKVNLNLRTQPTVFGFYRRQETPSNACLLTRGDVIAPRKVGSYLLDFHGVNISLGAERHKQALGAFCRRTPSSDPAPSPPPVRE